MNMVCQITSSQKRRCLEIVIQRRRCDSDAQHTIFSASLRLCVRSLPDPSKITVLAPRLHFVLLRGLRGSKIFARSEEIEGLHRRDTKTRSSENRHEEKEPLWRPPSWRLFGGFAKMPPRTAATTARKPRGSSVRGCGCGQNLCGTRHLRLLASARYQRNETKSNESARCRLWNGPEQDCVMEGAS